ncbi:hypothetical protein ADL12_08815 [Streptomyces regalis]|uniref:Uncharacterized protein n=1 Tax=Streptomyces regalis TaxID=68262 RepID=A0A0X3VHI3_9ACTN|nr:hypothetical protein ADL12_08815 [Streptomyces regalis]
MFTSLNADVGLSRDLENGVGDNRFNSCMVADMAVTVGLVADDEVNDRPGFNIFDMMHSGSSDYLPIALGGGWQGYTDLRNTGVMLPCENKSASLVVSINSDESHENPAEARAMGELAVATARKAADQRSCEARFGGRIPKVSMPEERTSPDSVAGTCKGIPLRDAMEVDWVQETRASGTAPLESCVLGETKASDADLYRLDAWFGPYAQRMRTPSDDPDGWNGNAGTEDDTAWATASCPRTEVRALFSIEATEYAPPTKSVLLSSLRAFAERSAARHGCTDLKLPG